MTTAKSQPPATYTQTYNGLTLGLGADDIAQKHKIPADLVRNHIAAMRRNGVLAQIYGGANARPLA